MGEQGEKESQGSGKTAGDAGGTEGGQALTFETWHGSLPDDHKGLVDSHVSGLKSALERQKESNQELRKQLQEALASKEANDTQKIADIQGRLEESDRKGKFYESAIEAGVKNVRLAYIAAKEDGLILKDGRVDADKLRASYPEFFAAKPPTNVSQGTRNGEAASGTFGEALRQAIGAK